MAQTEEAVVLTEPVTDSAPAGTVEEKSAAKASQSKKSKAVKERKAKKATARKPRAVPAHPPYVEMITEAITSLKERSGSSQYAITKLVEDKHKEHLPTNFKKLLLSHLKKLVATGKLVKVKNSFKLAPGRVPALKPSAKKPSVAARPKVAAKPKPAAKSKATAKPKVAAKPKASVKPNVVAKSKPKARPAKTAKTSVKASPGKKPAATKPVAPRKSAAAKSVKKPKSVKSTAKSPAKNAPANKAKKGGK